MNVLIRWAMITSLSGAFLTPQHSLAQAKWKIENDHPDDFVLQVTPTGGNTQNYFLRAETGVADIPIQNEPHDITSINQRDKKSLDHDPINFGQWAARKNPTPLSDIITPVGTTPQRVTIYQAMDNFPAHRKYAELVNDLKRSRWSGMFQDDGRNLKGDLRLNRDKGISSCPAYRGNIEISDIQYVPGNVFYITGDWTHGRNAKGELTLKIDPNRPNTLEGYFRYQNGRMWGSGKANRLRQR